MVIHPFIPRRLIDSGSGDIFKPLMSFTDETNSTNTVAAHTKQRQENVSLHCSKCLNLTGNGDPSTVF